MSDEVNEQGFWADFGDAVARKTDDRSIVGGAIQKATNSQGYRDRMAAEELARRKVALATLENEWQTKNFDTLHQQKLDQAAITGENLKQEKIRTQDAATQSEQQKLSLRMMQSRADQYQLASLMKVGEEQFGQEMATNPMYANLSIDEQKRLIASPRIQGLIRMKAYQNMLGRYVKGDKDAGDFLGRAIQDQGWSLDKGEDGVPYIEMNEQGRVSASPEMVELLNQNMSQHALKEMQIHSAISNSATLGDPIKSSIADFTRAVMPVNGNDATRSYEMAQNIFNNSTDEEKGWHLFHRATGDYSSSGLPSTARLAELGKCLPFLQKMGFSVEGFDPKNPDPNSISVIDLNTKRRMSFGEFSKLAEEKDSLGRRLENRVAQAQYDFMLRNGTPSGREKMAMQQSRMNAPGNQSFVTPNVKESPKKGAENASAQEPTQTADPNYKSQVYATREEHEKQNSKMYGSAFDTLKETKKTKLLNAQNEAYDIGFEKGLFKRDGEEVHLTEDFPAEILQSFESTYRHQLKKAGFSDDEIKQFPSAVYPLISYQEKKSQEWKRENGYNGPVWMVTPIMKGKGTDTPVDQANTRDPQYKSNFYATVEDHENHNSQMYGSAFDTLKETKKTKLLNAQNEAYDRGIAMGVFKRGEKGIPFLDRDASIKSMRDFENMYRDRLIKAGFSQDEVENLRSVAYPYLLVKECADINLTINDLDRQFAAANIRSSPMHTENGQRISTTATSADVERLTDKITEQKKAFEWRQKVLKDKYGIDVSDAITKSKKAKNGISWQ